MGRDDKKGSSNNTGSLPQTPKNVKIKPKDVQEEFAREFAELSRSSKKKK